MTKRVTTPSRRTFVLPVGLLVRVVVGVLAVAVVIGIVATGALARLASASTVADATAVAAQRSATEIDLERGYEQATDQVRKGRALKLAIPAQQADAIANKAFADLFTLRHSALMAIAQLTGAAPDASEEIAKSTEQSADAKRGQPQASTAPVLLAPRFYAVVSRFNQLATQLSDKAVADLTQSVTPTATASPTPTATARPTPTPSPAPTK